MLVPEICALTVFHGVKRHSRASLVFAEGVAHRCDGLHRTLIVNILWLDRHNTEVVVYLCARISCTHRLILQLHLLLRVENDVKIARLVACHSLLIKPA